MLEKDYIMRSIQQFGAFLAQVQSSVSRGNTEEAETDLQVGAERYLGLRLDLILRMDNEALLDLLGQRGNLEFEKLYIAAQLLRCEAGVKAAVGCDSAIDLYHRSLGLLLRGFLEMDESFEGTASSAIEQILVAVAGQELPVELYQRLIDFHEHHCQYDMAENRLFELVDNEGAVALELGKSFYTRLIEKTDSDLERGGLPRDEVSEGLLELQRRCQF